jgi:hypothetical protein
MTRHQRRKRVKLLTEDHNAKLLKANAAFERDLTVKRNLATRPERNYYPQSSLSDLGSTAARFISSGRGSGAMSGRQALALKMRGKW